MATEGARLVQVSLFSYGHANGPIIHQPKEALFQKTLAYNIRHLPNPPRHLRAKSTGLSRRLQKEFLQNDNVEAFLVRVQEELFDIIREGFDQGSRSNRQNESETEVVKDADVGADGQSELDAKISASNGTVNEDSDIYITVTVCCEEGQHRSVAFIEELSRRLSDFRHGDGLRKWQLNVDITHRDIADPEDPEQSSGQNKRPNKAQAKSRQKERRDKGNRYKECVEDDEG